MGRVVIVVGGQFGSEAKGAVSGFLARELLEESVAEQRPAPVLVRVGAPNAGHTVVDDGGRTWKLRQIPVGAVVSQDSPLVIANGSEVDPPVLEQEIASLDEAGFNVTPRLQIDGQATVIEDRHRDAETDHSLVERIGSTGKGVGAARADRRMRTARVWQDFIGEHVPERTDLFLAEALEQSADVLIEAAQGFGLGLSMGFYPNCTSANGRAIDVLADAGISPWAPYVEATEVWVVLRTYPIRVAGNSGPLYGELSWEELAERTGGHIQPERTTVTNKIRRIGEWDAQLARRAVEANGRRVLVALTFLDYIEPRIAGFQDWGDIVARAPELEKYVSERESEVGAPVALVGTGPGTYARTWREYGR